MDFFSRKKTDNSNIQKSRIEINDRNTSVQHINVITSCGDKNSILATVLVNSLSKTHAKYNIVFYLMHNSVSPENLRLISDYCDSLPNVQLQEIYIEDLSVFNQMRDIGGKPDCERFFWLTAASYLPKTEERAIYLDAFDTLVLRSIEDFYFADFEDKSLLVTPEINGYSHLPQLYIEPAQSFFEKTQDKETIIRMSYGIFNSGSVVLNLQKLRSDSMKLEQYVDVLKWAKNKLKISHAIGDQGLYSLSRGSDFKICNEIYNYRFFTGSARMRSDVCIAHFCGHSMKPHKMHFSENQEEVVIKILYKIEGKHIDIDGYSRLYDHYLPFYRAWWNCCLETPVFNFYHFNAQQWTTRKLLDMGWI